MTLREEGGGAGCLYLVDEEHVGQAIPAPFPQNGGDVLSAYWHGFARPDFLHQAQHRRTAWGLAVSARSSTGVLLWCIFTGSSVEPNCQRGVLRVRLGFKEPEEQGDPGRQVDVPGVLLLVRVGRPTDVVAGLLVGDKNVRIPRCVDSPEARHRRGVSELCMRRL